MKEESGLRYLVVVSLAVSKTFSLIMTVSQERLLAFGTDKMLQTHTNIQAVSVKLKYKLPFKSLR